MKAKIGTISVALLILSGCAFFRGEKIFTPPSAIRYRLVSDCYIVRDMDTTKSCLIIGEVSGIPFQRKGLPSVVSDSTIGRQYGPYTVVGLIRRGDLISVVGIEIGDSFEMGTFRIPIVTLSSACCECNRLTGAEIADRSTGDIRPEVAIRVP